MKKRNIKEVTRLKQQEDENNNNKKKTKITRNTKKIYNTNVKHS